MFRRSGCPTSVDVRWDVEVSAEAVDQDGGTGWGEKGEEGWKVAVLGYGDAG